MYKKVSICIPAYNHTIFLRKLLQSILDQNYTNYEIIITDDSDTDSVKKIIDEYDFGEKLHYFRNEKALGSPKNWNYCISKATGEYIKIVHHDDWFSNNTSLEKLVQLLESGDKNFAFCGCNNLSTDGELLFYHSITEKQVSIIRESPEYLFFANKIGSPSVTIFKNNKISFDNEIKYLVDIEFYIQLLNNNHNFTYTTESLINIGHSESQVTNLFTNNKNLLMSEYSYVVKRSDITKSNFKWYFKAFWELFGSFNIMSVTELKSSGWQGDPPRFIVRIIEARRFFKKIGLYKRQRTVQTLVYNFCKQIDLY